MCSCLAAAPFSVFLVLWSYHCLSAGQSLQGPAETYKATTFGHSLCVPCKQQRHKLSRD